MPKFLLVFVITFFSAVVMAEQNSSFGYSKAVANLDDYVNHKFGIGFHSLIELIERNGEVGMDYVGVAEKSNAWPNLQALINANYMQATISKELYGIKTERKMYIFRTTPKGLALRASLTNCDPFNSLNLQTVCKPDFTLDEYIRQNIGISFSALIYLVNHKEGDNIFIDGAEKEPYWQQIQELVHRNYLELLPEKGYLGNMAFVIQPTKNGAELKMVLTSNNRYTARQGMP